jgi:DNA (cytosine-5)-methyltransferase 1
MKLTHASVFSGIGGPEVAAAMLGWDNLFHCEINPFGRAVLEYWFPNATSYEDITKTDFSEWRGKVNVLTGGFPCQPFSYAGQRRGEKDDRYLWPYMHKCINQVRPDWVVCENVGGILTMVEQGDITEMAAEKSLFDEGDTLHRYRLDETFTLERICNDLENDGYAVQAVVIPACAVNAPHRRDRVFIIGCRNDIADTTLMHLNGGITGDGCNDRRQPQPEFGSDNSKEDAGRLITNTQKQRGKRYGFEQPGTGRAQQEQLGGRSRQDCGVAGCGRWDAFPTQSPVCRGNDGIPYGLDALTISPSKWRTESLKAYGNAIVPQVMYEIFRAIEETYDTRH